MGKIGTDIKGNNAPAWLIVATSAAECMSTYIRTCAYTHRLYMWWMHAPMHVWYMCNNNVMCIYYTSNYDIQYMWVEIEHTYFNLLWRKHGFLFPTTIFMQVCSFYDMFYVHACMLAHM